MDICGIVIVRTIAILFFYFPATLSDFSRRKLSLVLFSFWILWRYIVDYELVEEK